MANIKISRKLFEKEIGKLDIKMQNQIAMFGTTLESFDNEEIELEIFPNRPDLLSYQGFKRSFLSFLGKKTGLKKYNLNKPEEEYQVKIDSSVKEVRPFTACAIVKGLKLDGENIKEIIEIQEKLHNTIGRKRKKVAIGIYPLEKITLPITFKALEPDKIKFHPLESEREMSGLQILQRHATGKEYAHLLKGKIKFPIFVDASNQILSMPPIINSNNVGKINIDTKEVFIECSGFDFKILKKCLNILVTTFIEMGGNAYQMKVGKEITPDLSNEKKNISLENTNNLLGINLNQIQMKQLLEKMGYGYSNGQVEIPSWRTDILHEVDLIEDIAIAYGYENFVPKLPEVPTIGEENPRETIKRKLSEILTGLNMMEISNYHLTLKRDQFTKMGISEKQETNFVQIEESKTDYEILRKNLTHYLLKVFSENIDAEYPQLIFEIGKVFESIPKIKEKENLGIAIAPGNFTQIKQTLDYLFRMLNLKLTLVEPEFFPTHFVEGRVAEIFLDNKKLGFIGEIHPKILRNWKIKMPVALCEIELEELFEKIK